MLSTKLNNPPLEEVIFELRFKDPQVIDYELLVGQIFTFNKDKYPYTETLKPAEVPALLMPFTMQHRFREQENSYPLYQVGPGIMSFNMNGKKYNEPESNCWDVYLTKMMEFYRTYVEAVGESKFSDEYVDSVTLRYINKIADVAMYPELEKYFKDKLKINIDLAFASDLGLGELEHNQLQQLYSVANDKLTQLQVNIVTVTEENDRKLIIDIAARRQGFPSATAIDGWAKTSHQVIENYFFAITKEIKSLFK